MTTSARLLDALWRDFAAHAPQAARIHQLLLDRGEVVHNDHVALRTFDSIGVAALAKPFEACGWSGRAHYRSDDGHERARYWQHDDPNLPKIFISEIVVADVSPRARAIVDRLVDQLPAGFVDRVDLPCGRPWRLTHDEYTTLATENAHAAWVAAFGFRACHFALDVGALAGFPDLPAFLAFLDEHAFELSGAATIDDVVDVELADASAKLPACHYEFVVRQVGAPVSVAK